MNDLLALSNIRNVLDRAGWRHAIIEERPSLERLRSIIAELSSAVSNALQDDATPSAREKSSKGRGSLARWQTVRVMAHINSHIDSTINTKELAALARLSSFHFCRVFRQTFGAPPHRFVMQKRIALAQDLMLRTSAPLGRIAMDCGMADQAHFNKLFRRFIGESPGAWRRARVSEGRAVSGQVIGQHPCS